MLSRAESRKKAGGVSGNGKLLRDIETLNKGIYADKTQSRLISSTASSRAKSVGKSPIQESKLKSDDYKNYQKDSFEKDKKSSIWSWKGLKTLTHARSRKFNCCFTLQVHSINGLPPLFDEVCLTVHWNRRDGEQVTSPIRVCQGVAEFEEQLTHYCSVSGSRSGPQHSAKYEPKHSLLYVSVHGAPEIELGKHRIDLTRLLPITLEDLDEEKSSGKWTTSFKLSGKARSASLNVSFGYSIENSQIQSFQQNSVRREILAGPSDGLNIYRAGSLPVTSGLKQSTEDKKDLHEVMTKPRSELRDSVNILYQKLDEEMSKTSAKNRIEADCLSSSMNPHKVGPNAAEKNFGTEHDISEFPVTDDIEEHVTSEDVMPKIPQPSGDDFAADFDFPQNDEQSAYNCKETEEVADVHSEGTPIPDLESPVDCSRHLMKESLDSPNNDTAALHLEDYLETSSNYKDSVKGKELSLDDVADSVASDFLNMLGIEDTPFGFSSESDPESPRERLLKQFENDAFANGGLLNFDTVTDPAEHNYWGPSIFEGFEEMSQIESDAFYPKTSASMMENLETEALMHEWGLNERAFEHSPLGASVGFGSPINIPPEDPQALPPLAEGVGPFVQTKNGGFMRSMNPELFRNAKNGGSLIMQVSNPVVIPAEMGSGVMDILQGLASVGIEKLSMQAKKLMPLEDITGKTLQQIAWDGMPSLEGTERLHHESDNLRNIHSEQKSAKASKSSKSDFSTLGSDTEYVSLEDLAPMAMDKIEALSLEGLRIQSGMSSEEAPSNISTQSIGEFSALKGKMGDGGPIGLDGTCGLQLMDVKDTGEDVDDGLMGLSLTLDEWMKLDSGDIDASERTSKILAAHHATSLDEFRGRSKGEKRRGRSRKHGLLGNNFTVALMVQLRDPLRDYEPVGTPMLALIQVERVFVPPKPRFYKTVSTAMPTRNSNSNNEDVSQKPKEDNIHEEELIPQFKIAEVRVAGLKAEQGKKKLWGSSNQQQSGSRWLLANGMGKKNKHPIMMSKALSKSSQTLWSIS